MTYEAAEVFFFGALLDILYVLWFFSVSKKNYILAASVSMIMGLAATESLLDIFDDRTLRFSYILGLGVGTMLGLRLQGWIDGLRRKDT
jgi:hypothetical protein